MLATRDLVGDLISEETVFAANFALWRVEVFNQLVRAQTDFNMRHAVEIFDDKLDTDRRTVIAEAAQEISVGLHIGGIGRAGEAGGWYQRLTESVHADTERLRRMRHWRWLAEGERRVDPLRLTP